MNLGQELIRAIKVASQVVRYIYLCFEIKKIDVTCFGGNIPLENFTVKANRKIAL